MRRSATWLALAMSLLILGVEVSSETPPAPVGVNAAPEAFSAERAYGVLQKLLAEGVPHPAGTPENRRVKQRIVTVLKALQLEVTVQRAMGCSPVQPQCAMVENVVAQMPGKRSGPSVLLMAHYDSVAASPGALDNGVSVVTALEVARALSVSAPHQNPILFVFPDAEEAWMLGAEAFFEFHPLAKQVGVAINLEGSGSEGASQLLRVGPNSGWVSETYGRLARHPKGTSLLTELFKVLPNDTDFSVATRHGIPGLDFAIAGERSHYHTALDSVENLSLRSLQHHGDNVLPLVKQLASTSIVDRAQGNRTFHALFGKLWMSWPEPLSPALLVASLLLFILGTQRLVGTGQLKLKEIATGGLGAFSLFVGVVVANALVYFLLWKLHDTQVDWPAHPWPFRLVYAGASAFVVLSWLRVAGHWVSFWGLCLGAWGLWWGVAAGVVFLLPGAANLFLAPSVAAGALLAVASHLCPPAYQREAFGVAGLALATPFTLGLLPMQEAGMGHAMAFSTFPGWGLYGALAAPVLRSLTVGARRWSQPSGVTCAALFTAGCVVWSKLSPVRSDWRPQAVNLLHLQNADTATAHWMAWSLNSLYQPVPLPTALLNAAPWDRDVAPPIPWARNTWAPLAVAPFHPVPAPELTLTAQHNLDMGRGVRLRFVSPRRANSAAVLIPESASLTTIELNGQRLPHRSSRWAQIYYGADDYTVVRLDGVPSTGFELALEFESVQPVEVFALDWVSALPPSAARMLRARGSESTPIHLGDQAIVYSRTLL